DDLIFAPMPFALLEYPPLRGACLGGSVPFDRFHLVPAIYRNDEADVSVVLEPALIRINRNAPGDRLHIRGKKRLRVFENLEKFVRASIRSTLVLIIPNLAHAKVRIFIIDDVRENGNESGAPVHVFA